MRVLLDTHALLRWLFDDPQFSDKARASISESTNEVFVSSTSAWEISTKLRVGRLPEPKDAVHNLPALLRRARFETLPISVEHALLAGHVARRPPGPL